jgi:hypothetical protein
LVFLQGTGPAHKTQRPLKSFGRPTRAEHWQLVKDPCDYKYSSVRYYELNDKNFSFLKDLWKVF